ncbi:DgyrCDS4599 [Dimorphilus gyrociliatus]|uniref:Guanylate cyclase n=1 Tax=Dimorphilus gyrociliatus TaxID=2664684 RepID=A0A7I8VJN8_9ANNE|nr:DgyrCDS4599 [Dimorphilus gyrociliatus]
MLTLIFINFFTLTLEQVEIRWDPVFSPPVNIPSDANKIYSVPLNQLTSEPFIAYLYKDGNRVTNGSLASAKINIATIPESGTVDNWVNSGGRACQWTHFQTSTSPVDYPLRLARYLFYFQCVPGGGSFLIPTKAINGKIITDYVYHTHPAGLLPPTKRRLKVIAHIPGGGTVSAVSNPFVITAEAYTLRWVIQPPQTITANTNFSLTLEIVDKAGDRVTTGLDSTAHIILSVSHRHKKFFYSGDRMELLHSTDARLVGTDIRMDMLTFDSVAKKPAVNGLVHFNDLRILDVHSSLTLNATVTMARQPWWRSPRIYKDLKASYTFTESGIQLFSYNKSYGTDPPVLISRPIKVTAQKAVSLKLLNKKEIPFKISANLQLEPNLPQIEVRDLSGKRIFSGPDSELDVRIIKKPNTACISKDASFKTLNGIGLFKGSFCSPIQSVQLAFEITSKLSNQVIQSEWTNIISVTNEFHIALFIDLFHSGKYSDFQPHVESFARFALEDLRDKLYPDLLPGRKMVMKSFDTSRDVNTAIKLYQKMTENSISKPYEKILGIIGFGLDQLTIKLTPSLNSDQMPLLSTTDISSDFSDKTLYPYYNRISYHEDVIFQSIFLAMKGRKWNKIVLVRSTSMDLSKTFFNKAKLHGIIISDQVFIPEITTADFVQWKDEVLKSTMERVRNAGTTLIYMLVPPPAMYFVMRSAITYKVDGLHGFQWIFSGTNAWAFPFSNEPPICQIVLKIKALLMIGFNGAVLFTFVMDLEGFTKPNLLRIYKKYFNVDRINYRGIPTYTFPEVASRFVLGYDAVMAYARAITIIQNEQKTVTGEYLALKMRDVKFDGLSGDIRFNKHGNRPGFLGVLVSINGSVPSELNPHPALAAKLSRFFTLSDEESEDQKEIEVEAYYPLYLQGVLLNPMFTPIANESFMNLRRYQSVRGMWSRDLQKIVLRPSQTGDPRGSEIKSEYVMAPFTCLQGCGGNRTDIEDVTKFEFGECVNQGECKCSKGYYGNDCSNILCHNCKNGRCFVPNICQCDLGWEGTYCDQAICEDGCNNETGSCISPNNCQCISTYIGSRCHISLLAITIPTVIGGLILLTAMFVLSRWISKRQAYLAALKNQEWVVNWSELFEKCRTLKVEEIQYEILELRQLRHKNLISFVGACLTSPNCAILTEIMGKGALDDILANDSIQLGWDFRFSILKDIARGMDALHKTAIGSHGRLKSSNCLIDNRWTCKISDYGCPTMRFNRTGSARKSEIASAKHALLWTAPELLKQVKYLDDVKKGTKEGDYYSFGILLQEVCLRDGPFALELAYLEVDTIIDTLANGTLPENKTAKENWLNTASKHEQPIDFFRSLVLLESLPDKASVKKSLLNLKANTLRENPSERADFRSILHQLNSMNPVRGELIDNLVSMLERYSSNLESIVAERTKELQLEKAKTEELISQMLPKQVADNLKNGLPVEPETFAMVTIFFSDIVGFTSIARDSTPLQVVDLLNDLYTCFDAILDNYDVYKVETIGDAYMVVSGLPERNGNRHAGEIATMSLHLLSAMCSFRIRHMTERTLQLRVGMHSGSVVAGVVGLKMPRYCLFGDTVNTASRMESSSMALRVHMSESTAKILLDELGGFELACRGQREVKGKGNMTTYWLIGKDGFDLPLPSLSLAASEAEHEFK